MELGIQQIFNYVCYRFLQSFRDFVTRACHSLVTHHFRQRAPINFLVRDASIPNLNYITYNITLHCNKQVPEAGIAS